MEKPAVSLVCQSSENKERFAEDKKKDERGREQNAQKPFGRLGEMLTKGYQKQRKRVGRPRRGLMYEWLMEAGG